MNKHFYFGEVVDGYAVRVLNEREARAAAGLLFVFAILSFLYAYRTMDFRYTSIFITFFMVDFFIRVLVNPKYAPSLIVGRFFVSRQQPEYVGAAQKRFAWSIGLVLSIIMFWLVVVAEMMTPIKIYICVTCLILLFSETAFGICIGCSLHNLIRKTPPTLCPGGVCEVRQKEEIQRINPIQATIAVLALGIAGIFLYGAVYV
ncbi:DUF4395 domain-containing protein [Candidatus Thiothrix anitrata]|jgi:hypothetical protein|uniref:DUF4395 domain-containing protein n=1 Tax=Candidatus Thiothrix anitrata TaxID=2823902 RepID=A0ABX7X4X2_9GAMM|nr:DUF4395 domain-containing protein [Candidatus Thiothrix anitrata]QTR50936.1 DUF4395 domain-containing protein [Candidatus Thiothrix anitrata]